MGTILLKNIMTGDEMSDILISGGLIVKIAPAGAGIYGSDAPAASGVEVVDCNGKAAVPGFVNMHSHAAMSLMRGMQEDTVFHKWIESIWELEKNVDDDFIYWGTKVACLEMIKTGTVTFNDQYWSVPVARQAAVEMGIRPVLSYVILDRYDKEEAARQRDECESIYGQSLGWNGDGTFAVGIHSIYSVSEEMICWAADFARKHSLKIHIHLCETEKEVSDCIGKRGITPVKYLDDLGILGSDVIAAHSLWLSDEDIDILGRRGVSCVHNINSNLKLASGYRFRYNELRDAGANVCIGTDGCASSNNLDILEAMKTAAMVQKAWRNDPSAMPIDELVRMATSNGAKALGLNTGRIGEGMDADILIVDTDNTFFLSPAPFLANFIYSAHSDCIDSVISKGRFVMRGRTVSGEKEIISEARKVISRI